MSHTFTLDEATALLPRLREILTDMQETKRQIDVIRDDIKAISHTASGNGHVVSEGVNGGKKTARDRIPKLNDLGEAVIELGCEPKGIEEGLVDFRSEREGRTVYLCWKLGEDAITHWHELDTGFANRKPL